MRLTIHDVPVEIENFTDGDYNAVREILRLYLSDPHSKNREAILRAFAEAVKRGPNANPSDLWRLVAPCCL